MPILARKKANSEGVSLLELLLSISLIAILSAAAFPLGASFIQRNQLKNTRDVLLSYLNTSRAFSMGGKNGSSWGVYINEDAVTLFSGLNYTSRDGAFDQEFEIPASVNVTPSEVTFDKHSGNSQETEINLYGAENSSYKILIDAEGNVSLD